MPGKAKVLFQRAQGIVRELMDEPGLVSKGELSTLQRFVHFWLLVWTSFIGNRCFARSSALSHKTPFALKQMLLMA